MSQYSANETLRQETYRAPQFQQSYTPAPARPVGQLNTKRGLAKMFFLGIITLGIYPFFSLCGLSMDINIIANRYDGKKTLHYAVAMMLAPITLFIVYFIWWHKLCKRIQAEQSRRLHQYTVSPATFWLWSILGSFILVGPFIFCHKLMKSMNAIANHYNIHG